MGLFFHKEMFVSANEKFQSFHKSFHMIFMKYTFNLMQGTDITVHCHIP